MIIQNSAISMTFPKIENIKKQYIFNENILKDKFNEATILPIPDDAPVEIPRILITSKQEHSQLNIAPETINFQTIYTNDYTRNWQLCEEYINSRINDIFNLIDKFTDKTYNYIGVVVDLIWNDITKDGNKKLFYNLFGKEATDNLDDLVVKYTYIEKEKYYVNITLKSIKIYNNTSNNYVSGYYTDKNLQTHTIGIILDINDRYSFNIKKNYTSGKKIFEELMSLTNNVINNKLINLVEKGEY